MAPKVNTPIQDDTADRLIRLISLGKAAVVPQGWLDKLLSTHGKNKAIRRREKAHPEGGRERLYVAVEGKDSVRGRVTAKRVFEAVKQANGGITQATLAADLKMPLSTVAYNLRQLKKKNAVHY